MNRVKQIGLFTMAIIFSNVISAQEPTGKTQEEVKKAAAKTVNTGNEETQHKMGGKAIEQQMNQPEMNGEIRPRNIKKMEERTATTELKENVETPEEMKPMTDEQAKVFEEKKKLKKEERPSEITQNTVTKTEDVKTKAKVEAKPKTKNTRKGHLKNGGKKKKGKIKKAIKASKRK